MKKTKFMALLLMAGLTFTACDEDENFNPNLDVEETVTVDFEGNYFTALVDTPQYNGPMLYGELASTYRWSDPATTLTGGMTNKWGGQYGFSEGGAALSYYIDAGIDSLRT